MGKSITPGTYIPIDQTRLAQTSSQIELMTAEEIAQYLRDQLHSAFEGKPLTLADKQAMQQQLNLMAKQFTQCGYPLEIKDLVLENDSLNFTMQIPPYLKPSNSTSHEYKFCSSPPVFKVSGNLTRPNAPWKIES
jgi:hypothetical protein